MGFNTTVATILKYNKIIH